MSDVIVAGTLKLDSKDANQSVKSFKTELKEANQNLIQVQTNFGATSKEAITAAKRVAELKDRMQDAREVADLFDPGAKFQVFGNVVRTVAGGMTALTGTMALFGAEGEEVQKTLLKVQGALAITEGLNTIADSAKDFSRLGAILKSNTVIASAWNFVQTGSFKIAKQVKEETTEQTAATEAQTAATTSSTVATTGASAAMKILRGALIATGVGALVVGLVALVQNFSEVKKWVEKLTGPLDNISKFFGKLVDSVTDFVGVTSEASRAADRMVKNLETSIAKSEKFLELNADKYDQYTNKKFQADLDYRKKKLEIEKNNQYTEDEKAKYLKEALSQRSRIISDADSDRKSAQTKIDQEAESKAREHAQKLADIEKGKRDKAKELNQQILRENELANKSEREKELDQIQYKYEEEKKILIAGKQSIKALEENFQNEKTAIITKYNNADAEARKVSAEKALTEERELQAYKQQLSIDAILDEDARKQAKADIDLENKVEEINQSRLTEIEKQEAIKKVRDNYQILKDWEVKEKSNHEFALRNDDIIKELENDKLGYDEKLNLINEREALIRDSLILNEREKTKLLAENVEARKALDQSELDNKMEMAGKISGFLSQSASIFSKHTAANKIATRAAAVIDTFSSANKAFKSMADIPIIGPGLGAAAAAAAIIAGLKNIKEMDKVQIPGAASASTAMPNVSVPAPLRPQLSSTVLPQDQINQIGNAAQGGVNRTYVLDRDVKTNREREVMLNRAARLGG